MLLLLFFILDFVGLLLSAPVSLPDISEHRDELNKIMSELADSFGYIDYIMSHGLSNVTSDEIYIKFDKAKTNLGLLKKWKETTKDANLKKYLEQKIPASEALIESGKLLGDLATLWKNIDSENTEKSPVECWLSEGQEQELINDMESRLKKIKAIAGTFPLLGIDPLSEELMSYMETRLYSGILLWDLKQILNKIQKGLASMTPEDREYVHNKTLLFEKDLNILKSLKYDSSDAKDIRDMGMAELEVAQMIDEISSFLFSDYFIIDENGELTKPMTPDLMHKIEISLDRIKIHVENLKDSFKSNPEIFDVDFFGKLIPDFVELYYEALQLKENPKRKPTRALELLEWIEKFYTAQMLTSDDDAKEQLSSILIKPLEEAKKATLQEAPNSYKLILKLLFNLKEFL